MKRFHLDVSGDDPAKAETATELLHG
jgi:hypothetical protein